MMTAGNDMPVRRMILLFVLHGLAAGVVVASIDYALAPAWTEGAERIERAALFTIGTLPGLLMGALAALGVCRAAYWRSARREALPPFAFAFAAGASGMAIALCCAWLGRQFDQQWASRWVTSGGAMGPLAGLSMAIALTVGAIRRRRRDRVCRT